MGGRRGPFSEIAEVLMGQSPPGSSTNAAGLGDPLLNGPTEFGLQHPTPVQWTTTRTRVAHTGDVLFCVRGSTTGKMNTADRTYVIGRGLAAVRARSLSDQRFVSYALIYALPELLSKVTGSTFPNLSRNDLARHEVYVPPEHERAAIADVLGSLDDKIAANAKLSAVASQLLDALANGMLRGAAMSAPLSELATVTKGVSYRRTDLLDDSKRAMVTLKSITREGQYSSAGLKGYSGEAKPGQYVQGGEAVVAQTDLTQAAEVVGRAVRVPVSDRHESLVASLDLAIVRPRDAMSPEYLLAVLRSEQFRQHCRDRTSGTTVLHLGRGAIESFVAPIAESEVQAQYSARARAIHAQIDSMQRESETLARLRDVLLPELMSGKTRVRDAERVVEGVV